MEQQPLPPAARARISMLRAEIARLEAAAPTPLPSARPTRVLAVVAEEFGITPQMILAPNREAKVVIARHVAAALLRRLSMMSLKQIGRHMRRDHTSILHGIRRVEALAAVDPDFAARLNRLADTISPERTAA